MAREYAEREDLWRLLALLLVHEIEPSARDELLGNKAEGKPPNDFFARRYFEVGEPATKASKQTYPAADDQAAIPDQIFSMLDADAHEVIEFAVAQADLTKRRTVGSEWLLLGAVAFDSDLAEAILQRSGFSVFAVRNVIQKQWLDWPQSEGSAVKFRQTALKVLETARSYAVKRESPTVSPAHIIAAIGAVGEEAYIMLKYFELCF